MVYNLVATSLNTPVKPVWSCGVILVGVVRFVSDHRQNQTRAHFSARRDSGAAITRGDFTVKSLRKDNTSL